MFKTWATARPMSIDCSIVPLAIMSAVCLSVMNCIFKTFIVAAHRNPEPLRFVNKLAENTTQHLRVGFRVSITTAFTGKGLKGHFVPFLEMWIWRIEASNCRLFAVVKKTVEGAQNANIEGAQGFNSVHPQVIYFCAPSKPLLAMFWEGAQMFLFL